MFGSIALSLALSVGAPDPQLMLVHDRDWCGWHRGIYYGDCRPRRRHYDYDPPPVVYYNVPPPQPTYYYAPPPAYYAPVVPFGFSITIGR